MAIRIEQDTFGEICIEGDKLWGAQTQRSLNNFKIGDRIMPIRLVRAITTIKLCASRANAKLGKLNIEASNAICEAAESILSGKFDSEFPLVVYQTGSGTQTNMNVNEVIAHLANINLQDISPNDHVNMSQSTNDVFPTAIRIAVNNSILELIAVLNDFILTFNKLIEENEGIIKTGRTHLQDATPIKFSSEISGWREMISANIAMLTSSLSEIKKLCIGGTATGTGINTPKGYREAILSEINSYTGTDYVLDNTYHGMTSFDAVVFAHGAVKATACNLFKIANDVRLMASGPRCGLGEITIPENEPGSSIMPGKINPTQCEAMTMVGCAIIGNDTAISMAASQGNFELNVFMPLIADKVLESITLLTDAVKSFDTHCVSGIKPVREKMQENLDRSLMIATALNPVCGYNNATKIVKFAALNNISIKEAAVQLNIMTEEEYIKLVDVTKLV